MENSLENLIIPHLNSLLTNFTSDLELIIDTRGKLNSEEVNQFKSYLDDIYDICNEYSDLLTPKTKEKVNYIEKLLKISKEEFGY